MADSREGALKAYWRFFETFNTRDARQFGSALNFPHVRVSSRGPAGILANPDEHAASVTYDGFIASGWDHTVGAEPEVLHVAADKVHIRGGWTRYTKDAEPILSNNVTYIMTLIDRHWGVQSRFGIDPGQNADVGNNGALAVDLVRSALASMGTDNAGAVQSFHLPHIIVDPGSVEATSTQQALEGNLPGVAPVVTSIEPVQIGPTGVNVAFRAGFGDQTVEGVLLVTLVDGKWGIKSRSLIIS